MILHRKCTFLNQINGKIQKSGVIYPETKNPYDLYYKCYKHGEYFLFGKSRVKGFNDEPHFPEKI